MSDERMGGSAPVTDERMGGSAPVKRPIRPPRMPHKPEIELRPRKLGKRPSWCWMIRSEDGRLVGYGIRCSREEAIAYALLRFPDAIPPEEAGNHD